MAWPNGPNMGVTLLGCGSGWERVGTVGNLAENGSTECKLVKLALKHQARSKTTKNTEHAIVMKRAANSHDPPLAIVIHLNGRLWFMIAPELLARA